MWSVVATSQRIHTLSFDRTVKKIRTITRLFDKLDAARKASDLFAAVRCGFVRMLRRFLGRSECECVFVLPALFSRLLARAFV